MENTDTTTNSESVAEKSVIDSINEELLREQEAIEEAIEEAIYGELERDIQAGIDAELAEYEAREMQEGDFSINPQSPQWIARMMV